MVLVVVVVLLAVVAAQQTDPQLELALVEKPKETEVRYMQWAKEAGIKHKKVSLANFTNPIFGNFKLRGMEATEALKAGDLLASIPRTMIMSTEYAREQGPLVDFFRKHDEVFANDELALTVQLLYEMQIGEASQWAEVLAVLPHRFATSCEFSPYELRQLEGSDLHSETRQRQNMFEREVEIAILRI